ncbi:MAG TPA: hemerythrin domain-containing protein [Polyangiales bacterium]|jgi:hemerythrin-like domain-containing protein|nr:hemerythrin domain-containing protein [Polyangiales bacterium]
MTHKLEELASKAVGTVKAAKASFDGINGVFRHLMREHGEVSALLMRLKLSADPEMRRELWQEIRVELLSHEQAERLIVYPVLEQNAQTANMVARHNRDAGDLEDVIEELNKLGVESPEWPPTLERLIAQVQEHVRDEEEEYFPIADYVFKERSDDMLARFEKAKAKAKNQLTSSP